MSNNNLLEMKFVILFLQSVIVNIHKYSVQYDWKSLPHAHISQ